MRCSVDLLQLQVDASEILSADDQKELKNKIGELMGYFYLTVYVDGVLKEVPELAGFLENLERDCEHE